MKIRGVDKIRPSRKDEWLLKLTSSSGSGEGRGEYGFGSVEMLAGKEV